MKYCITKLFFNHLHVFLGLSECKWPGRFHTVKRPGITYYFDGAHTMESVLEAFKWFRQHAAEERSRLTEAGKSVKTVFLFNKTG